MPGLPSANIDEIINLAQRLEEVVHQQRTAEDDSELAAHAREIVARLTELVGPG